MSDALGLVGLVVAVVSAAVSVLAYRAGARKDTQAIHDDAIRRIAREVVDAALEPVEATLGDMRDKQARVETKVDLFWEGMKGQLAHVLHSPEPGRAELDRLLEKLAPDLPGHLSAAERERLKDILAQIVAAKHASHVTVLDNSGQAVTMPLLPNEQLGAGMLLATLEAEDRIRRRR